MVLFLHNFDLLKIQKILFLFFSLLLIILETKSKLYFEIIVKLSELLEQLTMILTKTKQLISEMAVGTGVGAIGTRFSVPSEVPKKKPRNRRRKSIEETVESVLRGLQNERS